VKSLREGRANLSDSYAVLRRGEAYLVNAHVSPYAQASRENPDPRRERKLLLNRSEIQRLAGKVAERGLTLVPLSLYFKNGRAKVELGLARGKRVYDKRQTLKRREQEREIERAVRDREDT
jgi:SsrA-binding protein